MDKRVDAALRELSAKYDIDYCLLYAVTQVESNGYGFTKDGNPKVLFEGHVFYRELSKDGYDARSVAIEFPTLCYQYWTKKHYTTYSGEWERLQRAIALNEKAAKRSASYGLFQVLGINYKDCQYNTIDDMYGAAFSTLGQVDMGIRFMISNNLIELLAQKNWAKFARRYNGAAYAKNKYDKRLAEAYAACCKSQNQL